MDGEHAGNLRRQKEQVMGIETNGKKYTFEDFCFLVLAALREAFEIS
jgi:hypothetical protein